MRSVLMPPNLDNVNSSFGTTGSSWMAILLTLPEELPISCTNPNHQHGI